MRKPRCDSKLANLPEETQEEIAGWCAEGLEVARDMLLARKDIAIALSSLSAWYAWWRRQQELRSGHARVLQTLDWYRLHRPAASPEEIRAATFLSLATLHEEDPQIQIALLKEQGRDLDRDLTARRVRLLEENAAKAKLALEGLKTKGGLTAETLRTIEEAAGLL